MQHSLKSIRLQDLLTGFFFKKYIEEPFGFLDTNLQIRFRFFVILFYYREFANYFFRLKNLQHEKRTELYE